MKLQKKYLFAVTIAFFLSPLFLSAQCPSIVAIMVNSCAATESDGEFLVLDTGTTGIDASTLTVDFASNTTGVNADVTPVGTGDCHFMLPTITLPLPGCPGATVVLVDPLVNPIIPANSIVVVFTSNQATAAEYDWSPMCGTGGTIYILQNDCQRTAGAFKDNGASTDRTTGITVPGVGCPSPTDELTYVPDTFNGNSDDGDYILACEVSATCPNGVEYVQDNDGCEAPAISLPCTNPQFINPGDQDVCDSYTLPTIDANNSSNLSGNEHYYTQTMGVGTVYSAGDVISATTTLFIYDLTQPCGEESFTINVTTLVANTPLDSVDICYTLLPPAIISENLAAVETEIIGANVGVTVNWYTDTPPTTSINLQNAADVLALLPTPATVYATITDGTCESAAVAVIVNADVQPTSSAASDVQCDDGTGSATFDLTNLAGSVGSGTVEFYEDAALTTLINPADNFVVNSSPTIVYGVVVGANGCDSPPANVTLTISPPINVTFSISPTEACDMTDVTITFHIDQPGNYTFNLQYGMPGNYTTLNGISVGDGGFLAINNITETSEFSIITATDPTAGCTVNFPVAAQTVTITDSPDLTAIGDISSCGSYTLPAIGFDANSTNASYFTGLNGTGTEYNIGDVFSTPGTTTLHAYAEDATNPNCSDDESFTITITPIPDLTVNGVTAICPGSNFDLSGSVSDLNNSGVSITFHSATPANAGNELASTIVSPAATTTYYAFADGGAGCMDEIPIIITVNMPPNAFPTTLSECDEGGGMATFNLTSINNTVNGGNGNTVNWFANAGPVNPIGNPVNFVASDNTPVFAQVTDGICPADAVQIILNVTALPTANPAGPLSDCGNANGEATFDLTSLNGTVGAGTINWYENIDLTGEILSPNTYVSSGGTVYATLDNGTCTSLPLAVTLTINATPSAIDPGEIHECGSPNATFNLTDATLINTITGGNGGTVNWFSDAGGNTPLFLPYMTPLTTIVYVNVISTENCMSATIPVTLVVDAGPIVIPVQPTVCDNGNGEGTFDLESFNNTLNDGTGLPVIWSTQSDGSGVISSANSFNSASTTVYAQVINGDCVSVITGIDITVEDIPTANNESLEACDTGNGLAPFDLTSLNFSVSNGTGAVSWFLTTGSNNPVPIPTGHISASATVFAVVTNGNCSAEATVTLTVNEAPIVAIQLVQGVSCNGGVDAVLSTTVNHPAQASDYDWNIPALDGQIMPSGLGAGMYFLTVTDSNNCPGTADVTITEPEVLTINCSEFQPVSVVGGSDGQAAIDINGGTLDYTLSWSGQMTNTQTSPSEGVTFITNLEAGNYSLTVTDNNDCTTTCSFTITDPACSLSLGIEGTNLLCNNFGGGAIDVTVNGSVGNVTFAWSPAGLPAIEDQIDLDAGDYEVTVTDESGCPAAIASITLTEPEAFSTFCQQGTPASPGGSDGVANVTITGGTLPYEVTWVGPPSGTQTETTEGLATITGLPAGFYSLHLVDANLCKSTCSFSIFETACDLNLDITGVDPTCNGGTDGSIGVIISGGTPDYTVEWNPAGPTTEDLIDLSAGTYNVTVTDANSCVADTFITLIDPTMLTLTCGESSPVSVQGGNDGTASIIFGSGESPYELTWGGAGSGSQTESAAGVTTITSLSAGDYMLTLTDNNNCELICEFTITEPGACDLSLDAIAINPLCAGDSTGVIDLTINGGTSPFQLDWNIPEFEDFEDLFNIPAGTYDVAVTDAASCTAALSIEVTEPTALIISCGEQSPVSTPNGNDGEVSVNISGGAPLYSLVLTGPSAINLTGESAGDIVIADLEAGEYTIEVTDENGCSTTCDFIINVAGCNMNLGITGFDAACFGSNDGHIELLIFNGNTPFDFNWDDDSLDGTQEPVGLASGEYCVTVTDMNGCSAIACVTISSPTDIILDCAQVSPVSAPGATDGIASVGIVGGANPYVLTWGGALSGSQNIASTDTITLANLIAGTYMLTVTDTNDCTTECTFTIETACAFDISLSPQDETCPGAADGIITTTLINETTPFDIDWNVDALDGTLSPTDLAAGTYMVTITDGAACVASDTIMINAGALPSATLSDNGQICDGDCFTFDLHLTGVAPFNVTYSVNDGNTLPLFFFTIMNADTTIELCTADFNIIGNTLTLIIEDVSASNCSNPIDLLRTVTVTEESFELIDTELCPDESIVVNGTTYDINTPNGIENMQNTVGCDSIIEIALTFFNTTATFIIDDICEGETILVNNVTYGEGNLTGTEIIENAVGCDSIVNIDLTLIPAITAALSGSTNICAGETTNLIFNSSTASTFSVQYIGENGTSTFLQDITDGFSIEVSPTATTTYAIEFIIISDTNCPVIIENSATVLVSNLSASVVIDQDILCDGEPVGSLSALAIEGIAPYTYLWSTNQSTPNISSLSAGTYAVTVIDVAGCADEGTVTLIAPNGMEITTSQTAPSCFNSESGSITIETVTGGDGQYEYALDGEFYQPLPALPFLIPNLLSGIQNIFIQDGKDCVLETEVFVPSVEEMILDLGADIFMNLGESTTLTGLINFAVDSIIWSPLDALESPNELTTIVNPTETTAYTLTVFDENGCSVSDEVLVIVDREAPVYIPTVFSPNDDGFNDIFTIYAGKGVVIIQDFIIFDRWGNAVYQARDFPANDLTYGWNGKYRGKNMNPAVFVYYAEILLADGRVELFKGDLTLIR